VVLTVAGIVLYRKRREEKIVAEVESYSEELKNQLEQKGELTDQERKEFIQASKDLENNDYSDALDKFEDINSD